ncbi:MAG: hypothetical protein EXS16_02725 [Gemmataceae bacterium]|nr:hypothetical protein [Gemmataceae bacterium]
MKARLLLASIGFMAITLFALAQQSTTQPNKGNTGPDTGKIITTEQQLARGFADFQDALLRLKQRLSRGTPEEKRRAEVLDKVIDECKNLAINQEFSKMIEILRLAKFTTTTDAIKAKEQSALLAERLKKIYDMLQDRSLDFSKDREDLAKIVLQIQKAIDAQRAAQGQTDRNKTDKDELKQIQEGVNKKTAEIGKSIDQFLKKDGKVGEAANLKGENKDPGKEEGSKGESKNDGREQKETKRGEAKQAGPEAKGAKGEAKFGQDPKAGEGKKSDAKPGDKSGKEGDAKPGAKDDKNAGKGQEGSAKPNAGEKSPMKGQEGNAKADGDKKDGPQGAAKPGEDKKAGGEKAQGKPDSQAKPGQPDAKQGGAKEAKAGGKEAAQSKPGDAKPSDKGGEAKQGDAKPGDSKSGQGEAKDGGAPPMPGQQAQQPQQKGGEPPQANNPPSGDKQDQEVQQTKKKIEEAGYEQKAATDNINKGDNKQASDKQANAIKELEAAKKRLEKLLQQLREEEIERVLAALENRCVKMLEMQKQVLLGTEDTDRSILKNADKKPNRDNKLASLGLADKQKDIVQECNKCITILESEGSAVAFPEVFQQIRQDMIHVQKRLELTDVSGVTQGIERDIIDTLKEMIDALKKAQEDNKSDSKPGKSGKAGKQGQGDKKLLELIQELKMVRSLQKRVNDRTVGYAKRFPGQEQTRDPQTVTELRNLAERQLRIQEIVSRIAKGDNK